MNLHLLKFNETDLATADAVADSIINYFSRAEETEEERVIYNPRTDTHEVTTNFVIRPMPMIEEWCAAHRVTTGMLRDLAKQHPCIARALEFSEDVTKIYLIRNGLNGRYNAQVMKFVATNKTDMVDRSEITNRITEAPADILKEIEAAEKPIRR